MPPLIPPPPASNEGSVLPPPPPPPPPEGRDTHGRFALGNPGKPRGARSKVAAEIDKMLEEAAPDAFETIRQAARHNLAAAMWIIERVAPIRKGRPISLDDFPPINSAADFAPALASIASSVASGDLSVDEAASAARALQEFLGVLETANRLRSGLTP
jgi:hypothetical protein